MRPLCRQPEAGAVHGSVPREGMAHGHNKIDLVESLHIFKYPDIFRNDGNVRKLLCELPPILLEARIDRKNVRRRWEIVLYLS